MPVNRNALIRYRTIDNCLRNRQRRWTLDDLIDACSDALYEYEGIDKGVSKRSVQMDIQLMRSDKLGYNAPIIVLEKKYYTYEDPDYSITNIPLTDQDLSKLTEVSEILRQFKGFSYFEELTEMVQRLENKIHAAKTNQEPVIDFEKNDHLKGLEHIETLYQAIIKKCTVQLSYQSFKARNANTFHFHPYYLKEYRNRWFVIGVTKRSSPILTLALDRIIKVEGCDVKYLTRNDFNLSDFLNDVIGVTVNPNGHAENVLLHADSETAPYIITKPLHHSQKIVENSSDGIIFSLHVQLNFELEREILGFGNHVKVIAPERLRRRIKDVLEHALDLYQFEFNPASLANHLHRLAQKGFCTLHKIFTRKELNHIKSLLHSHFNSADHPDSYTITSLFQKIPQLKNLVINKNVLKIIHSLAPHLFVTKAVYLDAAKGPQRISWQQHNTITVKNNIDTPGFSEWNRKAGTYSVVPPEAFIKSSFILRIYLDDADETSGALKVMPGSHHKNLSDDAIRLITQNSIPHVCDVEARGIQIMKPLLLHTSSKAIGQKPARVIHLEFNSKELPGKLEWAERHEIISNEPTNDSL